MVRFENFKEWNLKKASSDLRLSHNQIVLTRMLLIPKIMTIQSNVGGPSEQISNYLSTESTKDNSLLSFLSNPSTANYLKQVGATATAIQGIEQTDVEYSTDIDLGLWPVYPNFFPPWLKAESIVSDNGSQVVFAIKCELWEWDAFSGNEFYGMTLYP